MLELTGGATLARSRQEAALLRQRVELLIRRLFGSKSEKLDSAQLLLLSCKDPLEKAPVQEAEVAPRNLERRSALLPRPRKPRLPADLPVVEVVLDPPEVQTHPQGWRLIGQEVSEQLDYEPGRFFRRRLIRRKYVDRRKPDSVPVIAPLPACLQERSVAAPGLLTHVIVSKYCDHLPLYRQESIYKSRYGVELPRQTLARWVELAADWLKPVYQAMAQEMMKGSYLQIDETPVRYLEPGLGRTGQGYLWALGIPQADVLFQWHTSRSSQCLEKIIDVNFKGILQTDGYSAYACFAQDKPDIGLAGCWAHVRRGFFEAKDQDPVSVGWILRQIQKLYAVEANLREARAGPCLRQAIRCSQNKMIQHRLYKALLLLRNRYLPRSGLGKAIEYTLKRWPSLEVYLQNGRVQIDNNLIENAIRPTAVGKKNWLFFGEAAAGQRSAIIYSVLESCRRRGVDPAFYLRDVLEKLPSMTNWQIKEVTPAAYAARMKAKTLHQTS